jgi:hypothetical protein
MLSVWFSVIALRYFITRWYCALQKPNNPTITEPRSVSPKSMER